MDKDRISPMFIALLILVLLLTPACALLSGTGTGAPLEATQEGTGAAFQAETAGGAAMATDQPTPQVPSESLASPTPEATGALNETSPTAGVAGGGECTNPYYPVLSGASWTYSGSGGPAGAYAFTDTISQVGADGFTLTTQFSELTRTQEWSCTPEGLVALQYGGGSGSIATTGSTATYDTTSVTGVTLPASIKPGDTWTQTYEIQGEQTLGDGQLGTSTGKIKSDFRAVGMESVSVSAGTFEALRIDTELLMELTVTVSGITVPTTITSSGSMWYAPGVGWVKSISSGTLMEQAYMDTIELTAYTLP